MKKEKGDFYQELRKKIAKWMESEDGKTNKYSEFLLAGPDLFHLMCKLTLDKDVKTADKAKLGAAISYFVYPIDLLPEIYLGIAGYIDDIILAAYVIDIVIKNSGKDVVTKHWAGEYEITEITTKILAAAESILGNAWQKLKVLVKTENDSESEKEIKKSSKN